MKKRISTLLAVVLMCFSNAAFAAQTPMIRVAEREVFLSEPEGEMYGDVFTVPVRRLCDAIEARVSWYEDEKMIVIDSKNNLKRLFLRLDSENLRVFTFTSIAGGTAEEFKLDAPLKIVNDRTLVPLEQICKALEADYSWSEDKSIVTIASNIEINDEKKAELYIKADKEDVNEDDTVEISINVNNAELYKDYYCTGYTAAIIYNPEEFEFVKSEFGENAEEIEVMGADNPKFTKDSVKAVYITLDNYELGENKTAGKLTFKALSDNGGKFKLSDRISSIGNDTSIMFRNKENINDNVMLEDASSLKLNTEEIVVK